ncbi:MAG: aldose 1-epimerase family protein [Lachnospiraceae bacterium]|nr:aldose 1-epimerase family protein [Lachnospiraceae bacterium]
MALFQIGNDKITIQADSLGAELKSLQDASTGREYLWNADPHYWKRTSPVLFPLVGGLKDGTYRLDGREYAMGQHGFARDMEFQLKSQEASELWFTLQSGEETLEKYPYPFVLEIGYELTGRTVIVKWRVKNPAAGQMYFSIGGHPAFLCPINEGTKQSEYKLRFDAKDEVTVSCLEEGLLCEQKKRYPLREGILPVTEQLFDGDALVIENHQAHSVSLVKPDGTAYLTVDFDAPLFGIWSPPHKNAPFICIEPWYGRCDRADFAGSWKEREWIQVLEGGETFRADYRITITE